MIGDFVVEALRVEPMRKFLINRRHKRLPTWVGYTLRLKLVRTVTNQQASPKIEDVY